MKKLFAITSTKYGKKAMKDFATNEKIEYRIFIKSNKNPRTINSYTMSRCYYEKFSVVGFTALVKKVAELKANGEKIYEISGGLNTRVYGF